MINNMTPQELVWYTQTTKNSTPLELRLAEVLATYLPDAHGSAALSTKGKYYEDND